MRKLLFVVVSLLIGLATLSAQPGQGGGQRFGGTPEEQAKRSTDMMKDSLKLTAKQIAPVDSINLIYAKASTKLRETMMSEGGNFDRAAFTEQSTKLEDARIKSLEKVLTKVQLDAYKKQVEARRARMQQFGGQGGGQRPRNN